MQKANDMLILGILIFSSTRWTLARDGIGGWKLVSVTLHTPLWSMGFYVHISFCSGFRALLCISSHKKVERKNDIPSPRKGKKQKRKKMCFLENGPLGRKICLLHKYQSVFSLKIPSFSKHGKIKSEWKTGPFFAKTTLLFVQVSLSKTINLNLGKGILSCPSYLLW